MLRGNCIVIVVALAVTTVHAYPSLTVGLRANLAEHAAELQASRTLGFSRAEAAVPVSSVRSYRLPTSQLGMGSACPFESEELVFHSVDPLLSERECTAVRKEASTLINQGAKSTFTMTDTNKDVALHDLPETLRWLNTGAFARVASLAARCFPSAVEDATDLWIYRGLVIKYEAAAGLTHQPIHRDGALISCVVPLSTRDEYDGGGTYIEPLGRAIALDRGCALLHPSALRHAGHRITRGERWVLVLFLNTVNMRYGEHGRRFRARAQELFDETAEDETVEDETVEDGRGEATCESEEEQEQEEEEEEEEGVVERGEGHEDEANDANEHGEDEDDEELQCLLYALQVTDESDHEIWYDLGARAHELGDVHEALRCYQRAEALNPSDALLLGNLGVAHLELGSPQKAFGCYRRALAADAYDVNARFNAGELLLEQGRLRALAALLAAAPEEVMHDEGLRGLGEELRLRN